MKSKRITTWILVAMVLGIGTGYLCNRLAPDAGTAKEIAWYFSILTNVFLRLIKMIIAPLVFSTLVAGIARTGDAKAVGRIGLKGLGWFITASLVSLLLGMLLVNVLQPGHDLGLPLPEADAATNLKTHAINLKEFITHVFPQSIFESMAKNEILQILVFSVLFGFAIGSLKDQAAETIVKSIEELVHIMLKITDFVTQFAPVGVFGAMAAAITMQGIGVLATYGKFIGGFPQEAPARVFLFGEMDGIHNIKSSRQIEFLPYGISSLRKQGINVNRDSEVEYSENQENLRDAELEAKQDHKHQRGTDHEKGVKNVVRGDHP